MEAEATAIVELLKARRRDKHQREPRERWPEELPVIEEILEPEEVKANPGEFRCIGEEVSEQLDYQPAKFFRRQIIRRKFVSRREPELAPVIAPAPESLQQRCIAAPGLLAQIIVANTATTYHFIGRNRFTGIGTKSGYRGLAGALDGPGRRLVKSDLPRDQKRRHGWRLCPSG